MCTGPGYSFNNFKRSFWEHSDSESCHVLCLSPGLQVSNSPGFPGETWRASLGKQLSSQIGRPLCPRLLPTRASLRTVSVYSQVRCHLKKELGSRFKVYKHLLERRESIPAALRVQSWLHCSPTTWLPCLRFLIQKGTRMVSRAQGMCVKCSWRHFRELGWRA